MTESKFQPPGGAKGSQHPPHGPNWKRMHHRPFFWVAATCILVAMAIYIATNGLAFWPGHEARPAVPAVAP